MKKGHVILCTALVAAIAAQGEVRRVLEPLKPGEIVARGWLKGQLELSLAGMGGHLGEIEPDQMEKPYVTRDYDPANGARGIVGWCAEMGGEYAFGTAMLAYALDDPALIAKAAARVKAAMALQEPDGYLGAYRPSDDRQKDYNAWGCHWFYDTMLLEYYRTGDKAILDAVHRGLLWFVRNWSGEKKTDYVGPTIIEPASVVYKLTGDKHLLKFCEEYAAWLDKPGHKNGATFTTFPLTRHGYHVAAIAARLKVPAALAYASGKRAFLDAALKSHGDFHDGVGWQATYAPCADGEWVAAPSCVGETEYCDFIFYQQLFAWFASLTGDGGFADATERLVFNAAQGARAKDERTIGYMTSPNQWYATLDSSRWGPEPFYHVYAPNMNAACCPANSISLYPFYVLNAVSREGRDLRIMNYGPYDVRTKIDGADVRVASETDYPFGERVTLRVRADGWNGALRLRRPAWAERMTVTRGGKACPVAEKDSVVTIAGPWKGEEPVVVDFGWQPKVRIVRDRDFDKEPLKTVEWGALVFAQPVVEKWSRVERPKPGWGKDSAPPQPKVWPWLAISCEKEPVAYALPQDLKPTDIRVERTGVAGLSWQKPPVKLIVPMLRASAAYPAENRREPGVGSKYKGTHTPLPSAGLVKPDSGVMRESVELVPFGATCLRTTCFPTAKGACNGAAARNDVYHSDLYTQVRLEDITEANRATYMADAKAAGVDVVWLSISDFFEEEARRQAILGKLAAEIRNFEAAGFSVGVWINCFGWGNERAFFKDSVKITTLEGKARGGAVCPLDSKLRRALADNVRDIARAKAKFILMDDDYVQSARGLIGCSCPRHLARVAAKCGRQTVTCADVKAAFTGKPNTLRTAYLDVGGEVAMELARELRRTVDAVNPSVGMGLCASYTHWDVEGCDLLELVGAFAGKGRRVLRVSGAPYWPNAKLPGTGLADVIEFVRMQSAWTRGLDMTTLDENDPYPRKVARVPPWRCELYDKAIIADGRLGRHKYMLCYGPDRAEPGYLEAHLADMPDDPKLRSIFAGTEPYGVKVACPQHRLRTAELPSPFVGEAQIAALYSQPAEAFALRRKGIPTRFDGPVASDEPLAVTVRAPTPDIYQIVHCDRAKGEYAVLLENMGATAADVKIATTGNTRVLAVLRGDFKVVPGGIALASLPPHAYMAVRFCLEREGVEK